MKRNKRTVFLLLAVMVFTLGACGTQPIVGQWSFDIGAAMQLTGVSKEEIASVQVMTGNTPVLLEFTGDGRYIVRVTINGEEQLLETTYTLEGNRVLTDGTEFEYKVEGNRLFLTDGGFTFGLDRVK